MNDNCVEQHSHHNNGSSWNKSLSPRNKTMTTSLPRRRRRRNQIAVLHWSKHHRTAVEVLMLLCCILGIWDYRRHGGIHNEQRVARSNAGNTPPRRIRKSFPGDTNPMSQQEQQQQQQQSSPAPHSHKIPNILILTHSHNLLMEDDQESSLSSSQDSSAERRELRALHRNVQHTRQLHPTAQVRFLTDNDCITSIREAFALHHNTDVAGDVDTDTTVPQAQALIDYFTSETRGMIKADICRGAALYETGGLYLDVDLGVRFNLFTGATAAAQGHDDTEDKHVLSPDTEFATIRVHRLSNYYPRGFFQAFIAATPQHEMIWDYLQLFLQYYQSHDGNANTRTTSNSDATLDLRHDQPLGVLLLYRAYERFLRRHARANDLSHVNGLEDLHERYKMEIWQEVDSRSIKDPQRTLGPDVTLPTWGGHKRACKMIVLQWKRQQKQQQQQQSPLIPVPFYSRIGNSRQCPI